MLSTICKTTCAAVCVMTRCGDPALHVHPTRSAPRIESLPGGGPRRYRVGQRCQAHSSGRAVAYSGTRVFTDIYATAQTVRPRGAAVGGGRLHLEWPSPVVKPHGPFRGMNEPFPLCRSASRMHAARAIAAKKKKMKLLRGVRRVGIPSVRLSPRPRNERNP